MLPNPSPIRRRLVQFGIRAGLVAVPVAVIALVVWVFTPPWWSSAEFDVRNDTGQPITAFNLTSDDCTASRGPIAAGQTSSVTLPTGIGYTYKSTLADGRTFVGSAGGRRDEDDRGYYRSYTVAVRIESGSMGCETAGNSQ